MVIAQMQHITFSEFVPMIVGKQNLRANGIALRLAGFDSDYDIVRISFCSGGKRHFDLFRI